MRRKLLTCLLIAAILLPARYTPVHAVAPLQQNDEVAFQARAAQVIRHAACAREDEFKAEVIKPERSRSENLLSFLMAKAKMVQLGGCIPAAMDLTGNCTVGLTTFCLERQINEAILGLSSDGFQLGTDDIFCPSGANKKGDYDFVLRGLTWLAYNFQPSAEGFGLSPEAYRHLRDNLITVHGLSPQPDGEDYDYHLFACGNKERRTGTPGELVAGYEAVKNMCEAAGLSPDDCKRIAAADPEADEGCFSNILCLLGLLFMLAGLPVIGSAIIALAGPAATGSAAVVGAGGVIIAGASVPGAVIIATTSIPETENHILMIETARFLSNNLKQRDYECLDPALSPHICDQSGYIGHSELFDNARNGQAAWLLRYLQNVLQADFDEYNSRPYARKAITAIQSLYDMACALQHPCSGDNLRIKVAARAVLDYLSAKFAVSSSTLKRFAPFRRQVERKPVLDPVFSGTADFETYRFAMLLGTAEIPTYRTGEAACESTDSHSLCPDLVRHGWIELLYTAVSSYRLPPLLEQMVEREQTIPGDIPDGRGEATGCDGYLQHYHHDGEEIYYCARTFLLSAGGVETDAALSVLGFSNSNDHGVALSTTLLPHGVGVDRSAYIRFEGDLNEDDPADPPEKRYLNNSPNLCVDRNFACGVNLIIPDAYRNSACHQQEGNWHFIDATACPDVQADFYVAAYERACDCEAGAPNNFGVLEVVDARVGSFAAFKAVVLQDNDGPSTLWEYDEENEYRLSNGETVRFEPEEARIVRDDADLLAEGDVVWADRTGCVAIQYPRIGQTLILSMRNLTNPYTMLIPDPLTGEHADAFCNGRGDYRESYLVEP